MDDILNFHYCTQWSRPWSRSSYFVLDEPPATIATVSLVADKIQSTTSQAIEIKDSHQIDSAQGSVKQTNAASVEKENTCDSEGKQLNYTSESVRYIST